MQQSQWNFRSFRPRNNATYDWEKQQASKQTSSSSEKNVWEESQSLTWSLLQSRNKLKHLVRFLCKKHFALKDLNHQQAVVKIYSIMFCQHW